MDYYPIQRFELEVQSSKTYNFLSKHKDFGTDMVNPFNEIVKLFTFDQATLRGLSAVGFATHWIILQYSIGVFFITVLLEMIARKTKNEEFLEMSMKLSRVAVVLFAVGAATGSMSEFTLLLFWPNFLELVGKYYFAPFYLELFAFFAEVVFVYMYYYTWDRASPKFHMFLGVLVVAGIFLSALLIVSANTLMTFPPGIQVSYDATTGGWIGPVFLMTLPEGGQAFFTSSDLRSIMTSDPDRYHAILGATVKDMGVFGIVFSAPGAFASFLHAITASILVVTFTLIGIYSFRYYRVKPSRQHYYKQGLKMLTILAFALFLAQGVIGHYLAHTVSVYNPEKLAAFEGTGSNFFGLAQIPIIGPIMEKVVAFLAYGNPSDKIPDYDDIPPQYRAPRVVHYIYYIKMLLIGIMFLNTLLLGYHLFKKKQAPPKWLLRLNFASPVIIQIISNFGWFTREIGRKPWTVYGMMTVNEAARFQPVPTWLTVLVIVYCIALLSSLIFLIHHLFKMGNEERKTSVEEPLEPSDETKSPVEVEVS